LTKNNFIFANSQGRCGPLFNGRVCDCSGREKYCNTANGWCGVTGAHMNAQAGEEYDCAISLPPIETKSSKGFCVSSKGVDQNNGVIKIGSKDFGPGIDLQTSCFKLCVEYSKESDDAMTGCEAIFNQANRGCYFHTDVVEKANGVKNHACWIV